MRTWTYELDEWPISDLSAWNILADENVVADVTYDNEPGEVDYGRSKEDARQLAQFIIDACNKEERRLADRLYRERQLKA